MRAPQRYLRFFYYASVVLFFFCFNHCLSWSRAYSIWHLEGWTREGAMDYHPHGFDVLFHDDRHWRVNHCSAAHVRVRSNLTKCVTVVCNGDEMRFSQCVFLSFFFIFECILFNLSGISLRTVNTNFYGCYCAIFMVAIAITE